MKDSTFRTLHYVSVAYFKLGQYIDSKFKYYSLPEASGIYQRTINKLSEEKTECIVSLRDENHILLKAERLNF